MKKLLLIALCAISFVLSANAQTGGPGAQLSKEEKAKVKAEKEAIEQKGYEQAGFTPDQISKIKEINKEMAMKSNELKASSLTDQEKLAKRKEINEEKKAKLKELIGEDKYKKWMTARKELAAGAKDSN